MSESGTKSELFRARAEATVAAAPEAVYAVVSDLTRSGEWSVECLGGEWIQGEPGAVGAVFRGNNLRSPDVVSWAPVVRGQWQTEAEVVEAVPGSTFKWAMRTQAGERQESVWAFDIEPAADGGSVLVHHFRMGAATEGIQGITAGMDTETTARFFREWGEKLAVEIADTLSRVKAVIEKG